jgi:hypothetical protein
MKIMNMSLIIFFLAACVTVNAGDIDSDQEDKANPPAAPVLSFAKNVDTSSSFGVGDEDFKVEGPPAAAPVLSSPMSRVALGQGNDDEKKPAALGRDSVEASQARNQRKTKGKKRVTIDLTMSSQGKEDAPGTAQDSRKRVKMDWIPIDELELNNVIEIYTPLAESTAQSIWEEWQSWSQMRADPDSWTVDFYLESELAVRYTYTIVEEVRRLVGERGRSDEERRISRILSLLNRRMLSLSEPTVTQLAYKILKEKKERKI